MAIMKKIIFILSVILGTVALYAQSLNSSKRSEAFSKSSLIETAKNVAMTYGPAYVAYFKKRKRLRYSSFPKGGLWGQLS